MSKADFTTLLSKEQIHQRIQELGSQLRQDYEGKDVVALGILSGAFIFMADLVRAIDLDIPCEFMKISSYGAGKVSSGNVQVKLEPSEDKIRGKHILIVEDIVDTGNSLKFLLEYLPKFEPASIKICSLLFKEEQLQYPLTVDYAGFRIESHFVIGYGLDLDGKYRNIPEVVIHPS